MCLGGHAKTGYRAETNELVGDASWVLMAVPNMSDASVGSAEFAQRVLFVQVGFQEKCALSTA